MKQNLQITLIVFYGIILSGSLAGCSVPRNKDIAKNTTEFNLVAEEAGNEMLLLNIVRASKRRPMYFTSFGKLTGQMSFEVGTGSITIPFGSIGDGSNNSNSISPNASYKNSPLFDVAVLDTQEFTRGIMTPVPMETIEYYWSQGWHKEMLLYLFIRRIDIIDPCDPNYPNPVRTYLNYPGDPNFPLFQEQIRKKNWNWDIEKINPTSIGEVEADEASKLKNLIEVQKAGLKLTKVKGKNKNEDNNKMKLCLNQVNYVFRRKVTKEYKKTVLDKINQENMPDKEKNLEKKMLNEMRPYPLDSHSENKDDKLEFKVYLRSPEAILYYLGEILRTEMRVEEKIKKEKEVAPKDREEFLQKSLKEIVPMIYAGFGKCGKCPIPLFYACKKTDEDETPCVSVDYDGSRYVIPETPDSDEGCCKDRSMHVLSLVSLLIGQQKEIAETPTTATVSVVGR
jgi:hypothetical protein